MRLIVLSGDEGRSLAHTQLVLQDLGMIMSDGGDGYEAASSKTLGWDRFDETPKSEWQAVFGDANADLDEDKLMMLLQIMSGTIFSEMKYLVAHSRMVSMYILS